MHSELLPIYVFAIIFIVSAAYYLSVCSKREALWMSLLISVATITILMEYSGKI